MYKGRAHHKQKAALVLTSTRHPMPDSAAIESLSVKNEGKTETYLRLFVIQQKGFIIIQSIQWMPSLAKFFHIANDTLCNSNDFCFRYSSAGSG